jgi:hypothetical protein
MITINKNLPTVIINTGINQLCLCHDALKIGRSEKIRHIGLKDRKLIDRLPVKKG